jgi:hypothetical protein
VPSVPLPIGTVVITADGRPAARRERCGDLFAKMLRYLAAVANGSGSNVSANDNSKFLKSARLVYTPVAAASDKLTVAVDGLWAEDIVSRRATLACPANLSPVRAA